VFKQLQDLLQQIPTVDVTTIVGPSTEVQDGETVLGVVPDDLKALSEIRNRISDDLKEGCELVHQLFHEPNGYDNLSPENKAVVNDHILGHEKVDILDEMFWYGVKKAIPEAILAANGLGLRKDWKIVALKRERHPLEQILGGGIAIAIPLPFPFPR
jgi:hypothetical protein